MLGGEPPVVAPLDEEAFAKAEAHLGDRARCEEDVLSYIAFPAVAEKFFDERDAREQNICKFSIERME